MGKNGKYFTTNLNITIDFVLQVKASCNLETDDLLNDTHQFLLSHHQTISESAMHTYYSALPFTPHNTRLYSLYEQEASHSIAVLQGLSPTWTSCLSGLSHFGIGWNILGISPGGMWLACGQDHGVMILDARTTASQCQISPTGKINCLTFSPSESVLATVTYRSLDLWNTTSGINQKTQTLSRAAHFYAVAFSSQGQYLLLSSEQGLHLHSGTDASELLVVPTNWSHKTIIFTPGDMQVITGSNEGYIHFFTLSSNQLSEIQERRIFNGARVSGLVLRHDGKRLASSGGDGRIRIYDLPSLSPIATLQRCGGVFLMRDIAYHPMEEELAISDSTGCVVLWRQKEKASDWTPSIHSNHDWPTTGIAYCQSGTRMYTSTRRGEIKLWATAATRVQEPPKHAGHVRCYAFNQPTSLLATAGWDEAIILWNVTTGDCWKTLLDHTRLSDSLVFSDDGILLASGDSIDTTVWDVASGSVLHKLETRHDRRVDNLAFSEDNARLTTTTDEECFLWELKSGELLERRERLTFFNHANKAYYSLVNLNGWQTVASAWLEKKCKYGLCRPPGEYGIRQSRSPIFGDRAALFCDNGRVLILDISRVIHVYKDPVRQIEWGDRLAYGFF